VVGPAFEEERGGDHREEEQEQEPVAPWLSAQRVPAHWFVPPGRAEVAGDVGAVEGLEPVPGEDEGDLDLAGKWAPAGTSESSCEELGNGRSTLGECLLTGSSSPPNTTTKTAR
jgi:hypothetical protein